MIYPEGWQAGGLGCFPHGYVRWPPSGVGREPGKPQRTAWSAHPNGFTSHRCTFHMHVTFSTGKDVGLDNLGPTMPPMVCLAFSCQGKSEGESVTLIAHGAARIRRLGLVGSALTSKWCASSRPAARLEALLRFTECLAKGSLLAAEWTYFRLCWALLDFCLVTTCSYMFQFSITWEGVTTCWISLGWTHRTHQLSLGGRLGTRILIEARAGKDHYLWRPLLQRVEGMQQNPPLHCGKMRCFGQVSDL